MQASDDYAEPRNPYGASGTDGCGTGQGSRSFGRPHPRSRTRVVQYSSGRSSVVTLRSHSVITQSFSPVRVR